MKVTPAISNKAAKAIRQKVRSWSWQLRPGDTLEDLARECNPIILKKSVENGFIVQDTGFKVL